MHARSLNNFRHDVRCRGIQLIWLLSLVKGQRLIELLIPMLIHLGFRYANLTAAGSFRQLQPLNLAKSFITVAELPAADVPVLLS